MSKKVLCSLVIAVMIFGASFNLAQAQSMSISQLIELFVSMGIIPADKVTAAKAAISGTASSTPTDVAPRGGVPKVCYTGKADVAEGSSGADVSNLQTVLGLPRVTGYFGPLTKSAVLKFQASQGIAQTGAVDPITRSKLMPKYGCSSTATSNNLGCTAAGTGCIIPPTASYKGPEVVTSGKPSIVMAVADNFSLGVSKNIVQSQFNLKISAKDADYIFEKLEQVPFVFYVYKNGVKTDLLSSYPEATVSFNTPSSGVVTGGLTANQAFKIQQNGTIMLPINVSFVVSGVVSGTPDTYSVSLESVRAGAVLNDNVISTTRRITNVESPKITSAGIVTNEPPSKKPDVKPETSNPTVSVYSPGAGNSYVIGDRVTVKYTVTGAPSGAYITLALVGGPTPVDVMNATEVSNGTRSFEYTIPVDGCYSDYCYGSGIKAGMYKVEAVLFDGMPCGAMALCGRNPQNLARYTSGEFKIVKASQ